MLAKLLATFVPSVLRELEFPPTGPTIIYEDNLTINIIKDGKPTVNAHITWTSSGLLSKNGAKLVTSFINTYLKKSILLTPSLNLLAISFTSAAVVASLAILVTMAVVLLPLLDSLFF
jgi:hypothetical protein